MGWFWADRQSSGQVVGAPSLETSPPPGCPMHSPSNKDSSGSFKNIAASPASDGSCPYTPAEGLSEPRHPDSRSTLSKLNPLNYMPSNLSQSRSSHQTVYLPTERELSTIPKGSGKGEGNWVYPSPQQMYNAMLRKGYTDTDETAVESMVNVHNFLNEGAWGEIIEWERRFSGGLATGWRNCRRGEDGSLAGANISVEENNVAQPRLLRFMGRPKDMTPKATMLQILGWIYPSQFGCDAPFDRHDWFVQRANSRGIPHEVRYVIDYYSGPDEPTGEPVFYLDVRPAIDGPSAAAERLMRWGGDVWWRASGKDVREGS